MAVESHDGRRGIGALLGSLAEESAALVRCEVKLARLEIVEVLGSVGRGSAFTALAAVLGLLGALSLLTGLILLVGDQWLPGDRYWLAALVIAVITGALAAWLMRRGTALLSPSRLVPDETVETLKEDKEWLKRQLT